MNGQWKPGDVAMVTGRGTMESVRRIYGEYPPGENGRWYEGHGGFVRAENVALVRPLVVIDPEDAEQVERLYLAYVEASGVTYFARNRAALPAALRAFAAPSPPKPAEPTGLGAVAVDAEGETWVRLHPADGGWLGSRGSGKTRGWSAIHAVRVLSEGVTGPAIA